MNIPEVVRQTISSIAAHKLRAFARNENKVTLIKCRDKSVNHRGHREHRGARDLIRRARDLIRASLVSLDLIVDVFDDSLHGCGKRFVL